MRTDYYHGTYDPATFWTEEGQDIAKWEHEQPDAPEIQRIMYETTPVSVLEVGCGPGRNVPFFAGARLYEGMDISEPYLARAKRQYRHRFFFIADISKLELAQDDRYMRYDLVFCDSTLQHIEPEYIGSAVARMERISRKYVAIIEHTDPLGSDFFEQIHLFQHDYEALFAPYADLLWRVETSWRTQPAKKEAFLWKKL